MSILCLLQMVAGYQRSSLHSTQIRTIYSCLLRIHIDMSKQSGVDGWYVISYVPCSPCHRLEHDRFAYHYTVLGCAPWRSATSSPNRYLHRVRLALRSLTLATFIIRERSLTVQRWDQQFDQR